MSPELILSLETTCFIVFLFQFQSSNSKTKLKKNPKLKNPSLVLKEKQLLPQTLLPDGPPLIYLAFAC